MGEVGTIEMLRGLWRYHWWANRRLFEVATCLGDEAVGRQMGKHFSLPTLKDMFAHIYAADWGWLQRWNGTSPTRSPVGADFPTMAALRARWDDFERDQRAFVEAVGPTELDRVVHYKSLSGDAFASPMWQMLQHVPNHATHHRSEIATMITMISGSPPSTDLIHYYRSVVGHETPR